MSQPRDPSESKKTSPEGGAAAPDEGQEPSAGSEPRAASPRPRSRLGAHVVWALALLAVVVVVALLVAWLLTLRAPGEWLRPRVVDQLETSLSGIAGRQEAFLVAYQFPSRTNATVSRSHFLGDFEVGSSEVQASWRYSVDFGIDLDELGPLAASIACDEAARRCTWTVPPPQHRKPAIDTSSIRLSSRGSLLVSEGVQREHRDEVVRRLTLLTVQEIRQEDLRRLVRENVRVGLEKLAENALGGADLATIEVVFSDEALSRERPALPAGSIEGG